MGENVTLDANSMTICKNIFNRTILMIKHSEDTAVNEYICCHSSKLLVKEVQPRRTCSDVFLFLTLWQ